MSSQLEILTIKYLASDIIQTVNYHESQCIAITHHSTAIEGSTLTLTETQLLITQYITAKGKPMTHHLMVTDDYEALLYILDEAKKKTPISPEFLKSINSLVNKNTGQVRNTVPIAIGRICDDTKGDFRLGNVSAGDTYFVNYDKVIPMVNDLCQKLQEKISETKAINDIYNLSFDAHFYLVTIHPWFDGNGRTNRLLMNYIQANFDLPLSIVCTEDKADYIEALIESRKQENTEPIREFLTQQHIKTLEEDLEKFEGRDKGIRFLL